MPGYAGLRDARGPIGKLLTREKTKTIFRFNQITQIILDENHDRKHNCPGSAKSRICTDQVHWSLVDWSVVMVVSVVAGLAL